MKRRQVAILIAIVYVAIGLILVYNCYYFFALDSVVQSQSQEQLSREFKNNGHNSTIQISVKRSKAVLLTLIDRKSRFLWAYRLKDRTTATVNEALTKFLTTFNGPVHSFTVDRGTEFSGLVSLESQYGIKTYYCHAYTPAERGSNERFNRNLRYFYPKGTRFEHISITIKQLRFFVKKGKL
ncbi:IS30 family transposase [Lentilactobacillus buchneri]|nr:IS30 family transposase [Lentilactobacillus sp. Egmn17]